MDDLQIEMSCVQKGGKWTMADGKEYGIGLFEHFTTMQNLLWPDEDDHRWSRPDALHDSDQSDYRCGRCKG